MALRVIMTGDAVTLGPAEQKLARFCAEGRERANLRAGIQRPIPLKPGRSGVEQNVQGMGGEIAFARMSNTYPDLDLGVRSGTPDHRLHVGATVDSKATTHLTHPLLVVSILKKRGESDLYALLVCDWPTYTFAGFATEDQLFSSVDDIGHGPSYVLEPSALHQHLIVDADVTEEDGNADR